MFAQIGDEGAAVGLHLDPEHQAEPAYAFEEVIVIGDHLLERALEPLAHARDMVEEFIIGDDIEHGLARRAGERVAAIGRSVRADRHAGRRLLGREAGAHREAAANALGRGHDVRRDPIMFVGEELAGAGIAALDLVEDKHQVVLVGELAQAAQEFLARRADAAFALDRLDQEPGRMLVHRGLRGLEIVELDDVEARQQRCEAVAQLLLVGRADRAERAAVEGAAERDQLMLFRAPVMMVVTPRGLDRAFHRLGAGIGEEDGVGEGQLGEPGREGFALRAAIEVGDVDQRLRLLLDRPGEHRMAVAEQIDGDAAGEIEIFLAALSIEIHPLASHRPHRRARIDGHERGDGHRSSPGEVSKGKRRPVTGRLLKSRYRDSGGAASTNAAPFGWP